MRLARVFSPFALPGRTILLVLLWEVFAFAGTVGPFLLAARTTFFPPSLLLLLAGLAALFGMHQAFEWDIPFGSSGWDKLAQSSRAVRLLYGPAVLAAWLVERFFFWLLLGIAVVIVSPILAPALLRGLWKEFRFVRLLRRQGRRLVWGQVLPLVEQGKGFLLLELADGGDAAPPREMLSRLWWWSKPLPPIRVYPPTGTGSACTPSQARPPRSPCSERSRNASTWSTVAECW